jgi:protein kinase-like protein
LPAPIRSGMLDSTHAHSPREDVGQPCRRDASGAKPMPAESANGDHLETQLRQACAELSGRLYAGEAVRAEAMLAAYPDLASDADSALELIYGTEFVIRTELGERPTFGEYYERFPHWRGPLERQFKVHDLLDNPLPAGADTLPVAPSPKTVRGLDGYELLAQIGHGPNGVVYKARNRLLNRVEVVKLIAGGDDAGPADLARFRLGAESQRLLQHANVVQVHTVGEQDGLPYFAMEYVEGGSLARRIAGKAQPADEAARLVQTLAQAVHCAHQRGIVHRDLKPANVVLSADGTPKITDFGLAKRLDREQTLTATGAVMGTPGYMAPEQAAGKTRDIGPLCDVYALGAILYELLTGRPPFKGKTPLETIQQVLKRKPVRPRKLNRQVPAALESICLKCLEYQPRKRYRSAQQLADDLGRRLNHRRPRAHSWRARAGRAVRRHLRVVMVLGLLGGVALLAAAAAYVQDPQRRLERLQGDLERGKPVTLIDWTGPPRWYRIPVGKGRAGIVGEKDKPFYLSSSGITLLELLPDPRKEAFYFRAEVSRDASTMVGRMGIYFGHSRHPTPQGEINCFATLNFIDPVGVREEAGSSQLLLHWYREPDPGPHLDFTFGAGLPAAILVPTAAPPDGERWHQMTLKVTPEAVQFLFDNHWSASLSHERLRANVANWLSLSKKGLNIAPEFPARAGLGLFVSNASARFRNVQIEPLEGF